MDRTKISPSEFTGAIKRLSKATYKTSFVPEKVKRALRETGASKFSFRSATKRQFLKAVGDLQAEGVVKTGKLLAPKRVYEDAVTERDDTAQIASHVPIAIGKLPGRLAARKFIEYYGKTTGKPGDVKAVLRTMGLPTGGPNPRTGAEPHLVKRQMVVALQKLREAGKLVHPNIGADIARAHRRTEVFVQEGISQELTEQEQKRYVAAAHEDLPEGIQRSIGRPPAGSALHAEAQTRSSSANRASREEPAQGDSEDHATSASAIARRPKPYDPKTSISRRGNARGSGDRPELNDLPFDLE